MDSILLQDEIKNIANLLKKFGENSSKTEAVLSCVVKLTEEVGELSEQVMLWRGRQRDHKGLYNNEDAGNEIADVIISAMMIAYELDIDVDKALHIKIKSIKEKLSK